MEPVPRTTAPVHATGVVEFVPLARISGDATFRLRPEGEVGLLAGSIARLGQLAPIELRPLPGLAAPADGGGARYQVVAGFRRLAAVKLLARGRVLARVHAVLDDDDAWSMALTEALLGEPLSMIELAALRERVAGLDAAAWSEELLDEALVRAPVTPELREQFLDFLKGAPPPPVAAPEPDAQDAATAAAAEAETEPRAAAAPAPEPAADPNPETEPEPDTEPAEEGPEEVTPEQLSEQVAGDLWAVAQDLDLAVDVWRDLPEHGRRQIVEQLRYLADLHAYLSGARR